MGWWDDILPIGGSILGAVGGAFVGNPMAGAAIGGTLGKLGAGIGDSIDGGTSPEQSSKDQVAAYEKLYGQLPTYQGPPPGQGLTAADTAAFETARRNAQGFAQGREGALEQRDAASSGGAARSGKLLAASQGASQAGADRLNSFDLGQAGIASERDLQNREMLNNFNQRNMMMRAGITQGEVGAMQHQQDLGERNRYANNQNSGNLFSNLGAMSMFKMGGGGGAGDDYINNLAKMGQYDPSSIAGSGI